MRGSARRPWGAKGLHLGPGGLLHIANPYTKSFVGQPWDNMTTGEFWTLESKKK